MDEIRDFPDRDICKTSHISGTITYKCLTSEPQSCPYALNYERAYYCLHTDSSIFAVREPNTTDN
jgi:hypothetical protein